MNNRPTTNYLHFHRDFLVIHKDDAGPTYRDIVCFSPRTHRHHRHRQRDLQLPFQLAQGADVIAMQTMRIIHAFEESVAFPTLKPVFTHVQRAVAICVLTMNYILTMKTAGMQCVCLLLIRHQREVAEQLPVAIRLFAAVGHHLDQEQQHRHRHRHHRHQRRRLRQRLQLLQPEHYRRPKLRQLRDHRQQQQQSRQMRQNDHMQEVQPQQRRCQAKTKPLIGTLLHEFALVMHNQRQLQQLDDPHITTVTNNHQNRQTTVMRMGWIPTVTRKEITRYEERVRMAGRATDEMEYVYDMAMTHGVQISGEDLHRQDYMETRISGAPQTSSRWCDCSTTAMMQ